MAIAWLGAKKFTIRKAKVHPWHSVGACIAFWFGWGFGIILSILMAITLSFNDPLIYLIILFVGAIFIIPSLMIFFRAIITIIMRYTHKDALFWVIRDDHNLIVNIIPIYKHFNQNPDNVINGYLKRYNLEDIRKQTIHNNDKYERAIIKYM